MDIERMKKLLTSGIEAGNKVKAVRGVIKTYKTQKQDMYDDTAEILKPSIEVQKSVKKTIDNKQDELITQLAINDEIANIKQNEIIKKQDKAIKQLKDNQEELTQSLDTLSEIMSQKGSQEGSQEGSVSGVRRWLEGSVSGVKKWLEGQPSDYEPLDIIGEEGEEEAKPKPPETLFNAGDTEIIKKYGFDPTLKNIPSEIEIKKGISSTTGKMNSKNPITKKIAKNESKVLSEYLKAVKAAKVGKGIRRYNQPKRNAYKISQRGQYGGLVIDLPKLHGHLKVVAHKNGQKVYDKQADFDTLDLLTKRFNSRKNYSQLARSIFNDLNRLSEIPIHRTSKKYSKLGSGVVYYNNPQDLLSRLELLGGSMSAGNNSNDVREEFVNVVHVLNKLNVINNKQMNDLMKEYLI